MGGFDKFAEKGWLGDVVAIAQNRGESLTNTIGHVSVAPFTSVTAISILCNDQGRNDPFRQS